MIMARLRRKGRIFRGRNMAIPEQVKRQAMDAVSHKETTAQIRMLKEGESSSPPPTRDGNRMSEKIAQMQRGGAASSVAKTMEDRSSDATSSSAFGEAMADWTSEGHQGPGVPTFVTAPKGEREVDRPRVPADPRFRKPVQPTTVTPGGNGTLTSMVVPARGTDVILRTAPTQAARSLMPSRPRPPFPFRPAA